MSLKKGSKLIAGAVTMPAIQEMFFPVGSIVMGDNLSSESIVKSIYGGNSWSKITGALYGVGGNNIGNTPGAITESLPNVTGQFAVRWGATWSPSGIVYQTTGTNDATCSNSGSNTFFYYKFDLSRGSSIYKNNAHVLASGKSTYCWKRVS